MGGGGNTSGHAKCGLVEIIIFICAIVAGTACSICSKTMMQLTGVGITGEVEIFEKPLFQTFGMFVGMTFGLIMHWAVLFCKIPFPGYDTYHGYDESDNEDENVNGNYEAVELGISGIPTETTTLIPPKNGQKAAAAQKIVYPSKEAKEFIERKETELDEKSKEIPMWMYFFLAIPAAFDLGATALCMMGLRYLDVSIYQMLRGSGIIFVALMKQHVLKHKLFGFQWFGVFWNVISVILVGMTAMLNQRYNNASSDAITDDSDSSSDGNALLGVMLVMFGALIQAMQYVFEEKVMTMDIPAPPLLLFGMEGLWGTIFCLVIMYPLAYYLPGSDHGSYEDPFNTWYMVINNSHILISFFVYYVFIFLYNLFAVLVTYMLNSVWHAILDNFRPITVWTTDLFIFYILTSGTFGESWTIFSYIQVLGMVVLLYGTAIYNAPNSGSILLKGEWYSFFLDYTTSYQQIEDIMEETKLEEEYWEKQKTMFTKRTTSSFAGENAPYKNIHTSTLRGMGSPKL